MVKKSVLGLFLFAFIACNKDDYKALVIPPSDNVNKRFEQTNHDERTVVSPGDDYRIYFGSDIHTVETADNLKKMITLERNDPNAVCSIILGDFVTLKGSMHISKEAMRFDPNTQNKRDTVFTLLGNHDTMHNQWIDYKKYYNSSSYYITVQTPNAKDLYVILDSANGTLGTAQMNWFKNLLKDKRSAYRHCIIATHCNFFRTNIPLMLSGNFSLEETFEFANVASENKVDLVVQGHHHKKEHLKYSEVEYVLVETLKDAEKNAGYLILNVDNRVEYEYKKI